MATLMCRRAFVYLIGAAAIAPSALAADTGSSSDPPEVAAVRASIKAKNYDAALAQLKGMVVKTNFQTPDVYSLMGFALRKTGDRPQAMIYYNKALAADPTHKGALEYQGELFVELGQMDKAKENLKKLDHLCWFGCEEEDDLKEAIADASKAK